jgi:formylglycine-generating enzyme required for sulfatase activity/WD40 repeat protein
LFLLAGIVITITNKDGTKTEINVPDDAGVEVRQNGKIVAKIPAKPENPPPLTTPAGIPALSPSPPSPVSASPIDYPAERQAAVWVVQHGSVEIADEKGEIIATVTRQRPQLPEKSFVIVVVALSNADIDDAGLANLAHCQQIREAVLDGNPKVTAKGLTALQHSTRLRKLNVAGTAVGAGLGQALASWSELETLLAQGSQVDDDALKDIPELPRLQNLSLADTAITEEGLARVVERCPNLREISGETSSGSLPVAALKRLRFLRRASLRGDQLTDEAVAMLVELSSLEHLELRSPVTDATLRRLPSFGGKLLSIRVTTQPSSMTLQSRAESSDSTPESQATKATALESHATLTAAGYAALLKLPDLTELQLDGQAGAPTDESLVQFAQLPVLRKLVLRYDEASRGYTTAGIAEFRRRRPDVQFLADGQESPVLVAWPAGPDGGIAPWNLPEDAPPPAIVPFSPREANKHQDAWAKYLQEPVEVENSLGMKFRLIPPGECITCDMADGRIEANASTPVRQLRVDHPFHLGTTEVTCGQFQKFVEATGYETDAERWGIAAEPWTWEPTAKLSWKSPGYAPSPDLPVTQVTPRDAQAFCQWISKTDQAMYRLPTEDEWEIAARGGGPGLFGWCQSAAQRLAVGWFQENIPQRESPSQPVGTKMPASFGLYDILGNVWEHCDNGVQIDSDTHWSARWARRGMSWGGWGMASMVVRRVDASTLPDTGFRVLRESGHPAFRDDTAKPKANGNSAAPLAASEGYSAPAPVRPGKPLSDAAVVSRPAKIPGVRSWSVELHTRARNSSFIVWSPRGDVLATAGNAGAVGLWDRDGNPKGVLFGHTEEGISVAFSPDGKLLASGGYFPGLVDVRGLPAVSLHSLRLWDTETGRCVARVPTGVYCRRIAFSPTGKRVVVCSNRVGVFDLASGGFLTFSSGATHAAWSPDEQRLAITRFGLDQSGQAQILDAQTLEPVGDLSAGNDDNDKPVEVFRPVYSPDGRWIAAVGRDRKVHLWDATSLQQVRTFPTTVNAGECAWHKDGQRLAVWGEGQLHAWELIDISSSQISVKSKLGIAGGSALSPDGTEVASWSNDGLVFSSAETGKILRSSSGLGFSRCGGVSVSPDGQSLLAIDFANGEKNHYFDARTGCLLGGELPDTGMAGWLPDGNHSVTYGNQKLIVRDQAGRGRVVGELVEPRDIARVVASPDSRRIAAITGDPRNYGYGAAVLWDWASDKPSAEIFLADAKIATLAWSPDGRWIAAAAMADQSIRLWNAESGSPGRTFRDFPQPLGGNNVSPIVWQADSRHLWITMAAHAALLDITTGQMGPLEPFDNGNLIGSLALSPDGDRLLVWEGNDWTFLRDGDRGQRRLLGQHLSGHLTGSEPKWLPDGRRFVGVSNLWWVQTFDVGTNRRLGTLFPLIGHGDKWHWLCVGPEGHYRGGPLDLPGSPDQPDEGTDPAGLAAVEEHLVYVAQLDDGSNVTLSPQEFRAKFGWQNDPKKARLLQLDE